MFMLGSVINLLFLLFSIYLVGNAVPPPVLVLSGEAENKLAIMDFGVLKLVYSLINNTHFQCVETL